MGHLSYRRIGRRYSGMRGFRLNQRRFSVQRLRAKFLCLFRLLSRWRSSSGQALGILKRSLTRSCSSRSGCKKMDCTINTGRSSSTRNLPNVYHSDYRLKSFARSNSFYSEAIADCLEFIKRSSVSAEDDEKKPVIGPR